MPEEIKSFRKKEIYQKLKGFNREIVKQTMIRILCEKRMIPEDYAKKHVRTLKQSEADLVFAEFL